MDDESQWSGGKNMKPIYFDYGATSPVRPEVLEAMLPFFATEYANSGSIHDFGKKSMEAIQRSRSQIASVLGASSPREIVFTSSGTEANNLAIIGTAKKRKKDGKHIITSTIEHPSVLETCRALEKEGFSVTYLPVDSYGRVRPEDVRKALTEKTILVSIIAANNEVGTIQPIAEIAEIVKSSKALFHTDAVQYFGKVPFTVSDLGVDLLSIGSHKIYGPKGAGALYIKKGVRIEPLMYGGGQERGIRPSTLNTPAIIGFGAAAHLAGKEVEAESKRLAELRDYAFGRIQNEIGDVELNGHPTERLPGNLNLSFHGVEGQAILLELNRKQMYVSSGSACSAGKHAASHVLMALGKSPEVAYQSLRITFGRETSQVEVDQLIEELKKILAYFRSRMS